MWCSGSVWIGRGFRGDGGGMSLIMAGWKKLFVVVVAMMVIVMVVK